MPNLLMGPIRGFQPSQPLSKVTDIAHARDRRQYFIMSLLGSPVAVLEALVHSIQLLLQRIQAHRDGPQLRCEKILHHLPSIFDHAHSEVLALIIAHSYRSASAGSTFAALPLG